MIGHTQPYTPDGGKVPRPTRVCIFDLVFYVVLMISKPTDNLPPDSIALEIETAHG